MAQYEAIEIQKFASIFVYLCRRSRQQFEFPAKLKYHALRSNVNFKTKSVKKFQKFSFFFSKAEQF